MATDSSTPLAMDRNTPAHRCLAGWGSAGKVFGLILLLASGLLTWLAFLHYPVFVASEGCDASWSQALGYFLKHHMQAGKDYIFTFGPLGYFYTQAYDSDLFAYKFLWEVGIKLAFVLTLLLLTRRLPVLIRVGCLVLVTACAQQTMPDAIYVILVLGQSILILDSKQGRAGTALALGSIVLLASVALVKFNFLLLTVLNILLIAIYFIHGGWPRRALHLTAGFAVSFVGLWLALGQDIGNLPVYLIDSARLAFGYGQAMGFMGARMEVYLALAIVVLVGAAMLVVPGSQRLTFRHLTFVLMVAAGVFLQWKHGFVRHDLHALSFFSFCLFLPFVLLPVGPECSRKLLPRGVVVLGVVLLSGYGLVKAAHADPARQFTGVAAKIEEDCRRTWAPDGIRDHLDAVRAELAKQNELPQTKAMVQDAPIDVLSYEQGVILLNDLHWQPRPVFQSYSTYHPALSRANAVFLAGDEAPQFLLYKVQPIDQRLPSLEDCEALFSILRDFEPVLEEKGFVLFRRHANAGRPVPLPTAVRTQTIHLNEEVRLGDGSVSQRLALDVQLADRGQIRNFLYKPCELGIRLRMANDNECTFRFIPALARTGFLINPLILDNKDIVGLYGDAQSRRVVSFCLVADAKALACYKHQVAMRLECLPGLVAKQLQAEDVNRVLYTMFKAPPKLVRSQIAVEANKVGDTEVLMVHAEGLMKFDLPRGSHEVSGRFGILPEAYEKFGTDGVEFAIKYVPANGPPRVLLERNLDPRARPEDGGMHDFCLAVPAEGGELLFETFNLPGKNGNWDWSFWTGIAIH
jgi:hypothetical protein